MRKTFLIFVVLAVVSVAFLFCGAAAVNDGRDDIVVTETTLAGDAAAAEGLQVRTVLNEMRQLYWTTEYDVSVEPKPVTNFRFYPVSRQFDGRDPVREAYLSIGSVGFGMNGHIDLEQELAYIEEHPSANQILLRPVVDVARRTAAGETCTEVLDLSDFYEYYPVYLQYDWAGLEHDDDVADKHWEFYSDYFKLPVAENTLIEVSVTKDAAGQVMDVGCNTYYPEKSENDADAKAVTMVDAYTYTESVVMEDAVYFLFHGNHDYSQIKGGYGLYRIPVAYYSEYNGHKFSEPQGMLQVEQIENIYPLDPAVSERVKLAKGVTDGEVLLAEQLEDRVLVSVLDTQTLEVRQTVELQTADLPEEWYHEDLLVFGSDDGETSDWKLHVLRYEDGVYTLWLENAFFPLNDGGYYHEPVFAFDGERFAMAAFHQYYEVGSHRITVYDRSGLLYAGDIHYSSDDLTQPITNYNWDEALTIHWK